MSEVGDITIGQLHLAIDGMKNCALDWRTRAELNSDQEQRSRKIAMDRLTIIRGLEAKLDEKQEFLETTLDINARLELQLAEAGKNAKAYRDLAGFFFFAAIGGWACYAIARLYG